MSDKNKHATSAVALSNLAALRGGAFLEEVSQALANATAGVKKSKKKAQVCITLTIEPADKKDATVERVWLSDEVKTKLPPSPKRDTLMFVSEDKGVLSERDPQQDFIRDQKARPVDESKDETPARVVGKDAAVEARTV